MFETKIFKLAISCIVLLPLTICYAYVECDIKPPETSPSHFYGHANTAMSNELGKYKATQYECMQLCRKDARCLAFTYAADTQECATFDRDSVTGPQYMETVSGVWFYDMRRKRKDFTRNYLGACQAKSRCVNGGSCVNDCSELGYTCVCPTDFYGKFCENEFIHDYVLKSNIVGMSSASNTAFTYKNKHYLVIGGYDGACGTPIYRYNNTNKLYEHYQDLTGTSDVQKVEHFKINEQLYILFVADSRIVYVYTFNSQTGFFEQHQAMATQGACDASYLELTTNHYLLVTNGTSYEVNSTVYRWNFTSNLFVEYVQLPSHGSLSGKLFSVDGIMYAAIATLNGTAAAAPEVWKIKENFNTDFNNGFDEWTQENVDTSSIVKTDFQTGFDGWAQEANDDFYWTRMKGATPSTNTGPANGASGTGDYYVYIETSSPITEGMSARLRTPLQKSQSTVYFYFLYHMYGDTIGTLNVSRTSNLEDELLWTRSGNQGNGWYSSGTIQITHNGYGDNYIVFEAIKGSSFTGDIAIDHIRFYVYTDFQTGFDGWVQENNDGFDWTRIKGATPSTNTGPTNGLSGTGDYYVYVDTSHATGMSARLSHSFSSSPGQQMYLYFYYHMYGTTGTLKVYRTSNLGDELLWSRSGNQGNQWIHVGVNFEHTGDGDNYNYYNIVFEAIKGSPNTGDIAIDRIYCYTTSNFETGFNGWTQEYNWKRRYDSTSTNTGPANGHSGNTNDYYSVSTGNERPARLRSLLLPLGQRVSLSFFYHMYGATIGTLNVYRTSNLEDELLWTRSGNQGDSWRNAVVQFEKTGDEDNYIVFKASKGSDGTDDIAIDDIQYCCSNESDAFWPTGIETFTNEGDTYLVAVNPLECAHTIIVYRWDKSSDEFKIHQRIPVEHCPTKSTIFKVGGEVFMIITTSRTESSGAYDDLELYTTSSPIFKLEGSMFVNYGTIPSHECYDITFFERDGEYFLGQSNQRNVSGDITNPSFNIYQWV